MGTLSPSLSLPGSPPCLAQGKPGAACWAVTLEVRDTPLLHAPVNVCFFTGFKSPEVGIMLSELDSSQALDWAYQTWWMNRH